MLYVFPFLVLFLKKKEGKNKKFEKNRCDFTLILASN